MYLIRLCACGSTSTSEIFSNFTMTLRHPPGTPLSIGRCSTQLVKGLSRILLGTAGLVFCADILVPVLGTSKLAESNVGIAVKICNDQLCSQIVTDRRDSLTRNRGTVHILIFMLLCLALDRTGLALEERLIQSGCQHWKCVYLTGFISAFQSTSIRFVDAC